MSELAGQTRPDQTRRIAPCGHSNGMGLMDNRVDGHNVIFWGILGIAFSFAAGLPSGSTIASHANRIKANETELYNAIAEMISLNLMTAIEWNDATVKWMVRLCVERQL